MKIEQWAPTEEPVLPATVFYRELSLLDSGIAASFFSMFCEFATDNSLDSLNRFWRLQLASLPIDTREYRTYLRDAYMDIWLIDFMSVILPVIRLYGLPRRF